MTFPCHLCCALPMRVKACSPCLCACLQNQGVRKMRLLNTGLWAHMHSTELLSTHTQLTDLHPITTSIKSGSNLSVIFNIQILYQPPFQSFANTFTRNIICLFGSALSCYTPVCSGWWFLFACGVVVYIHHPNTTRSKVTIKCFVEMSVIIE